MLVEATKVTSLSATVELTRVVTVAAVGPVTEHGLVVTTQAIAPARDDCEILLDEEKARVVPGHPDDRQDVAWYLDSGATNHMTSNKEVFTELDEKIKGTVCFGDGLVIAIQGRNTTLFAVNGGVHHAFNDVFFIPALESSVISLDRPARRNLVRGEHQARHAYHPRST